MTKLNYKKIFNEDFFYDEYDSIFLSSETYKLSSLYEREDLKNDFILLRSHIVDLTPANIVNCITGTEQDFYMLMNKAKEFLNSFSTLNDSRKFIILQLFKECVFGFYVLTPLIKDKAVSDIKVYAWNHITCKANGKRYITNLSFASEDDYLRWYERIIKIQELNLLEENSLQHTTDRKGSDDYYLRLDVQLRSVVSSEVNNIHIRKMPKRKYTWEYLIENGMLTDEMIVYLKDRIAADYGFLISGKGGSGKSTLLNNMIDLIPHNKSVLVVQESDELYSDVHPQIQFEHTLELFRDDKQIYFSLEDELRLGLLQDIDTFVIGEIKGGEALYCFTTALSTGANFYGTIHSNNAAESVRRLADCAKYISDYSVESLTSKFAGLPFVLIHMTAFSIDEILEVKGWDEEKRELTFDTVYLKNDLGALVDYDEKKRQKIAEREERFKKIQKISS